MGRRRSRVELDDVERPVLVLQGGGLDYPTGAVSGLGSVGSGFIGTGRFIPESQAQQDELNRGADRADDEAIEQGVGTRASKDKDRSTARDASVEPSHPAKDRALPVMDAIRTPLNGYQRRVRSVAKNRAMGRMSSAMARQLNELFTSPKDAAGARWRPMNDALHAATGSVHEVEKHRTKKLATEIRRLDRSIRLGEQESGRTHVVYANVAMPDAPHGGAGLEAWAQTYLKEGDSIALDGYTMAAHDLHEISDPSGEPLPTIVVEMRTRRGLYLGGDESKQDTTHLLPRNLRGRITGIQQVPYRTPDGSWGKRVIVQVEDADLPPSVQPDHLIN